MKKSIVTLVFFLLFGTIYGTNFIRFDNPTNENSYYSVNVVESNASRLVLDVSVCQYDTTEVLLNKETYAKISIPDCGVSNTIGLPEFPVIGLLYVIPVGRQDSIIVLNEDWKEFLMPLPYPHQRDLKDKLEGQDLSQNDSVYYNMKEYHPLLIESSESQWWNGIENKNLRICPFRYDFGSRKLSCLTHLKLEIQFASNNNAKVEISNARYSALNESIYSSLFINENIIQGSGNMREPVFSPLDNDYNYLIIVPNQFKNAESLRAFVDWKSRMGFVCKIVTLDETGTNEDSIKRFLQNEHASSSITYVLLVGNESYVVQPYRYYSYQPSSGSVEFEYVGSDFWYGCLDGDNDYQPELCVGRFCVSNEAELDNMIYKTINYEKNPPSGSWLKKNLLIAHRRPSVYQDCCDSILTYPYRRETPDFIRAYGNSIALGGTGATNDTIIDIINNGVGIVNYRGHGANSFWDDDWSISGEPFSAQAVASLNNYNKHPVVFSIACLTGRIRAVVPPTLSELFCRGLNGSVAFLGSTIEGLNLVNTAYDKNIYRSIYDLGAYGLGDIQNTATIMTFCQMGRTYDSIRTLFSYWWNGDPSLTIHTDSLQTQSDVSCTATNIGLNIDLGMDRNRQIVVNSALDNGNSYSEIVTTPNTSSLFFDCLDSYYVTVKKHNYYPLLLDTYIQNAAIYDDVYISGNNIYIGSSVTPNVPTGNVTIGSTGSVILCPSSKIHIDGKTRITLGSQMKMVNTKL